MSGGDRGRSQARLLSVRLQGFKSFADRTHVTFGPGISAIVGPNGSGKSNLADALRWALGEQGRALRSRKSEDVIWAGSEKRAAVGMADVQLTLDNEDALLPVEYGAVELGRRLYRSGENDYLLNRQRVRLKDLVDLLDAGHLAENAFLFIGQGMVDQALSLRPEERRGLFEEVAGVRRHERRRRRAEEQLAESESNLTRVDDILAELRPQARRLAQQAEQQANRLSAAEELAGALLLSAHARWHAAAGRATVAAEGTAEARRRVDAAMAALLEQERAITAAGAALAGQANAETAARTELDRVRAAHGSLQLRESRHASEADAAARDRARLDEARAAAESDLSAARQELALPLPHSPAELEAELATLDAEIAAARSGLEGLIEAGGASLSAVDAAAVRRLEAARAQELGAARRRADEAERAATEESARSKHASEAASAARAERDRASGVLGAARAAEKAATLAREAAQSALADVESAARSAADRLAGARAASAAAAARHDDARRALDAAEGAGFSKAARARGGTAIGDGLIIDPALQPAVDAALAGLGRAQVLPRDQIVAIAGEQGVAIPVDAIGGEASLTEPERRLIDAARARGGGPLGEAIRRDDPRAVTRLLQRVVWVPDAAACLELQPALPPGWLAVARDGSVVAGEVATWLRPDGRGLHLRGDADRLADERAIAEAAAAEVGSAHEAAQAALAEARAALARARETESNAVVSRRRAEETERGAIAAAESATRDAAWAEAQASRLQSEAARLVAALPEDAREEAPADAKTAAGTAAGANAEGRSTGDARDVAQARERRMSELQRQRGELTAELDAARATRLEAERRRARAEAAASLAERQLSAATRSAEDLAEREARLAAEREELVALLASATQAVAEAEATLASVAAQGSGDRERLRAAEASAASARERLRIAQERARIDEREDVEARIALEALREQLVVELAALGPTALRILGAPVPAPRDAAGDESAGAPGPTGAPAQSADSQPEAVDPEGFEPEALESALASAAARWAAAPPEGEPPSPTRLATLRRRFHDVGAVNPFAADEYAEVKARLEGLDAQRSDLQSAVDHTRELIRELDGLIADQFRRTFEALERAFDERFQQLFGGGYARLSLTDPEDLAATGIEIIARPPGKKAQALAMLSGGERALTAVALLFAMLKVRPVPFCVLDEVDAALDEANIGRFTDALRELADGTQCIVITHNRGTIESADALYGVTVGDDSVSRVISLRLDEATALARRANGTRAGAGLSPDNADTEPIATPAGAE